MSTIERAIAIAAEAHSGQTDKAGAPYVLHPLRVMLNVRGNDAKIVAVLHDVVEDCEGWSFERLQGEGFSEKVLAGLASVTKRADEPYEQFVQRAADNSLGRAVKIADMRDNSDLSRISDPSAADYSRVAKYQAALRRLGELP